MCSLLGADKPAASSSQPGLAARRPQARGGPSKDALRSSLADDYAAQELWQTNSRAGSSQQLDAESLLDDFEDTGLIGSKAGPGTGSQAGMSAAQRSARPGRQGSEGLDVAAGSFRSDDQPSSSGLLSAGRAVPVSSALGLAGTGSTLSTGSLGTSRPGSMGSQSSASFLATPAPPLTSSRGSAAAGRVGLADSAALQPVKSLDNARMNPATSALGDRRSDLANSDKFGRPGAGQTSRTSGMPDSHLSSTGDPRFPSGKLAAADEDDALAGISGLKVPVSGLSTRNQGQSAVSSIAGIDAARTSSTSGQQSKSQLQDAKAAQKQSSSTGAGESSMAQTSRTTPSRPGLSSSDAQQLLGMPGSNLNTPAKQSLPTTQANPATDMASRAADESGLLGTRSQQQPSNTAASKSFQDGQQMMTAGSSMYPPGDLDTDSDVSGSLRGSALQRQASMNVSPGAKLSAQQPTQTSSRTYPTMDLATDRLQPGSAKASSQGSQAALPSRLQHAQPATRSYPDVSLRDDLRQADDDAASHLDQVLTPASRQGGTQSQARPAGRTYPSMPMVADSNEADDSFSSMLQQPSSKLPSGSMADRTSTGQLASLSSRGRTSDADTADSLPSSVLRQGQDARQFPAEQQTSAGRLGSLGQQASASDSFSDASVGLPRERKYPEMQLKDGRQAGASGLQKFPAVSSQKGNKSARQQGVTDDTLGDQLGDLRSLPSGPVPQKQGKSSRQDSLAAEGLTPLSHRLSQTPATDASLEYDAGASKPAKTSTPGLGQLSSSSKQSQKATSAAQLRSSSIDKPDDIDDELGPHITSRYSYSIWPKPFALMLCRFHQHLHWLEEETTSHAECHF